MTDDPTGAPTPLLRSTSAPTNLGTAVRTGGVPVYDATASLGRTAYGLGEDTRMPVLPSVELPRGGGALRGLAETISTSATGTAELSVPLGQPPGRDGFGPTLALSYSSAAGNGTCGLGWGTGLAVISLRTEKGVPRYDGHDEVLLGAEPLVRVRDGAGDVVERTRRLHGVDHIITTFRPRLERNHARIERWAATDDPVQVCWRVQTAENTSVWYGVDAAERIADPLDPRRIAGWLPSLAHDDRGNAIRYHYAAEDGTGVDTRAADEQHRTAAGRTANRYLRRASYGNRTPYRPDLGADSPATAEPTDWAFHLVLDYGDHDLQHPGIDPDGAWPVRPDPWSAHRTGFELRTYRRCRRVLVFHAFPALGADPVLTAATSLTYTTAANGTSLLSAVVRTGYGADGATASLPALELDYQPWAPAAGARSVDPEELVGAPAGLAGTDHTWVDLEGDGAPGLCLRTPDQGWYYKRNLSPLTLVDGGPPAVRFAPPVRLPDLPSGLPTAGRSTAAGGSEPLTAFADADGDGLADVLVPAGTFAGIARRTGASLDGGDAGSGATGAVWAPLQLFDTAPVTQGRAAAGGAPPADQVSLVDLTGDGLADLLVTGVDAARWHPGRGGDGFGAARPVRLDDDAPVLLTSDARRALVLADLDGDGLPDLVEVTRTAVRYRPSLGHGRFGLPVQMTGVGELAAVDDFEPARVLVTDVDGDGCADLVYLGAAGSSYRLNQSGNRWSAAVDLPGSPGLDQLTQAGLVDLFGRGTAALVWSTPVPRPDDRPLRYVDLAPAGKPYLLRRADNGLGASFTVDYTPSTAYAVADAQAGRRWPDRLPFPVQCASRITALDGPRGTTFTHRHTFHQGRYDGVERQFMGFGRIDSRDTEALGGGPDDLPPTLTRRWYHTGDGALDAPLHSARADYADLAGPVLPEPDLPSTPPETVRHLLRALSGTELRVEIYAEDGTPAAAIPYLVTERTVEVRLRQPGGTEPPVLQVLPVGEISYASERDLTDPRVSQDLVLETDDLGLVTASARVLHGRRRPDPTLPAAVSAAQTTPVLTCHRATRTTDVISADTYRLRATASASGYQLTGFAVPAGTAVVPADLRAAFLAATVVDPDDATVALPPAQSARLLGTSVARFLDEDLAGPLPAGQQASHGLVAQTYRLVLTPAMVTARYGGTVSDAEFAGAGYRHLDGDANWWLPSARLGYPAAPRDHFLQPDRLVDAFGTTTTLERADDLLLTAVVDPRGHRTEVHHDLFRLTPDLVTDANGLRTASRTDPLGSVTAIAVLGSVAAPTGDTLDDPTVGYQTDLDRWRTAALPTLVTTRARERHGPANPRTAEQHTFLDGAGAVLAVKAQAAGAPGQPDRWIGTGRTVLDAKGLPVRVFEPYFSADGEFDSADEVVEVGVANTLHHDPLGRGIRVDHPDGSFERVDIAAWQVVSHDAVDTVLGSRWYTDRGSPDPAATEPADPEVRAAWLAARAAGTPATTDLDVLGRPVQQRVDNGGGDVRHTRVTADVSGLHARLTDTRERLVLATAADLLGRVLVTDCAERGVSTTLVDAAGSQVFAADALGRRISLGYDDVRRPVRVTATEPGGSRLISWVRYGDDVAADASRNAIGRVVTAFDESGRIDVDGYDVDGAATGASRRFRTAVQGLPDWSGVAAAADPDAAADLLLLAESWHGAARQDALGRPVEVVLPDQTVLQPGFDVGGRLATVDVQPGGAGAVSRVLAGQTHDAAGRPETKTLGNGLTAAYGYDPLTRRLTSLDLTAPGGPARQQLRHTYDPIGHLLETRDDAQQSQFFANAVVSPGRRFRYDALYQLVLAEGRELAALSRVDAADVPVQPLPHPNDTAAVRRYRETYDYDDLGNLTGMGHSAGPSGWRRDLRLAYETSPGSRSNRVVATNAVGDADGVLSALLGYDALGNLTSVPHLTSLSWDLLGRLADADLGGGGTVHYSYGIGGGRTRKVVDRGAQVTETLYLGGVEVVRTWLNGTLTSDLRIVDVPGDGGRLALVHRELPVPGGPPVPTPLFSYTHHDALGSTTLVTDETGALLDHEEYYPYGGTAYRSSVPGPGTSLKRYRFLDRERDDETGFAHLGLRLYAPWLGRFTSPDPAGYVAGPNLYRYARNCPATLADPTGLDDRQEFRIPSTLTTPAQVESYLRSHGFDFTGPVREVSPGRWDVGTWLQSPGEGPATEGSGAGATSPPADTGGGSGGTTAPPAGADAGAGDGGTGTAPGGTGGTGGTGGDDGTGTGSVGDAAGSTDAGTTGTGSGTAPADGTGTGADEPSHAGEVGGAAAQAGPGSERFIWDYEFPGTGVAGTQRGRILEWLLGVPWRDNTQGLDRVRGGAGQQIWSTERSLGGVAAELRNKLRQAAAAIAALPGGGGGLAPQMIVITRTDAPAAVDAVIAAAQSRGSVPAGALPPEHIRGLPGPAGVVGRGLSVGGAGLSAYALYDDISRGDAPMAVGDGLSTIGGGLELYAIASPGATVAGYSAMSAGLAVGGIGIAIASGVSAYRSFQRGDTAGGVAGLVGVAAGLAITIGVVAGAPLVLAAGIVAAIGVGLFHVGRWLDFW